LPVDNHSYFENDLSLVDCVNGKTEEERDEVNIRSLGKMIFSGEE
jgi:hypothetical protein